MRTLRSAGLTAIAVCLAVTQTPARAAENQIPMVVRSTVVIDTADGTGAGFFIAKNKVLTAAHVVAGSKTVTVRLGQVSTLGTVEQSDPGRDLAVIVVTIDAAPLMFVTETPDAGSSAFAVGNPLGGGITVSRGVISGTRLVDGQTDVQTDAAVNPGNSGGPLVTADGKVIGVVVSKIRDAAGIALAVPASTVKDFLAGKTTEAPASGGPKIAPVSPRRATTSPDALIFSIGGGATALGLVACFTLTRRRRYCAVPEIEIILHPPAVPTSR